MTGREALGVVTYLQAAFPTSPWSGETVKVWVEELHDVGADEGKAAARAVVRGQRFPSVAVFYEALAVVREQRLDDRRTADVGLPALGPGEHWLPPEENARRMAELRDSMRCIGERGRIAVAPHPIQRRHRSAPESAPPSRRRFDEDYFAQIDGAESAHTKEETHVPTD